MSQNTAKHIYHSLPTIVVQHKGLSSNDKMVMLHLYQVLRDRPFAHHRNKKLAQLAGLSERTVARSINTLETAGFLVRQGNSFNRKFSLGKLFAISKLLYGKISSIKKNLITSAKAKVSKWRQGKHTKNLPNNINTEELHRLRFEAQQRKWYKDNPSMPIHPDDEYLFL